MSMMGRFVQVSPDRLKQILDDPSEVEALLRGNPQGPSSMPGPSPMTEALGNALTQPRAGGSHGRDQLTGSRQS